jgi:hypothetical protein
MKIGVCIPCHFLYVKFLDRLFLSIDKKTYKPHIVYVSISGLPPIIDIPKYQVSFNLNIINTTENKNSGENRNISAFNVKNNVDIISFFDADDFMHPQRLESINNAFKNNGCDVFLHNYLLCDHNNSYINLKKISDKIKITCSVSKKYNIYKIWTRMFDDNNKEFPIANGHISFKSSIFSIHNVPENKVGCEDSLFTTTLTKSGYIINATVDKLSLYCYNGREKEKTKKTKKDKKDKKERKERKDKKDKKKEKTKKTKKKEKTKKDKKDKKKTLNTITH